MVSFRVSRLVNRFPPLPIDELTVPGLFVLVCMENELNVEVVSLLL